ncbi:fluoride efflux transporter CrcB [Amnibacterium soli]|uniref:Fluoride-specific ion channel FluC n=1 Tax=Amnibacterium soli TaxID=1282736 RepID=A0ABP8ZFE3_9MICO
MTALGVIAVCAAGGVGAAARLLIDGALRTRLGTRLPWGTLTINVSGSLLLGLLTGLARSGHLVEAWQSILGTGLLGGYTTFSTASYETVRLLQQRRLTAALINGPGMLTLCIAAAAAADALGAAI